MTKVRVVYHGEKPKVSKQTGQVMRQTKDYELDDSDDNWKDEFVKEFRNILNTYKGIESIEFYVPQRKI